MPYSHHAAALLAIAAVQVSYIYPILHIIRHWVPHLRDLGILHGQLLSESFPVHLGVWELAHLIAVSMKKVINMFIFYWCWQYINYKHR